jgi:hypothetical protein
VRAATLTLLETYLSTIIKFQSKYPNGYNLSNGLTITKTASIDSRVNNIFVADEGEVGATGDYLDFAVCQCDLEATFVISSVSLVLTPKTTQSSTEEWAFESKGANYTITDTASMLAAFSAIHTGTTDDDDLYDTSTWTADENNTYILTKGLVSVGTSIKEFATSIFTETSTTNKIFDDAQFIFTVNLSGYPYWFEIEQIQKSYNENEFTAELLLKARWAL